MRMTFAACGVVAMLLMPNVPSAQERAVPVDVARLAGTWDLDSAGPPNPTERRVITVSADSMRVEILRPEDARPPRLTCQWICRSSSKASKAMAARPRSSHVHPISPLRGAMAWSTSKISWPWSALGERYRFPLAPVLARSVTLLLCRMATAK